MFNVRGYCLVGNYILWEVVGRWKWYFYGKVFSVLFGENMFFEWLLKGIKWSIFNVWDFYFGFVNVEKLWMKDFEKLEKMNVFVVVIKGIN